MTQAPFARVLVGYAPTEQGADARALGVDLGVACGADLLLVSVVSAVWLEHPGEQTGPAVVHGGTRKRAASALKEAAAGITGLPEAIKIARTAAIDAGLTDPRVTSDAKHAEIGLTDKSDSGRWIMRWLWRRGIAPEQVLIAGDELGQSGSESGPLDAVLFSSLAWPGTPVLRARGRSAGCAWPSHSSRRPESHTSKARPMNARGCG